MQDGVSFGPKARFPNRTPSTLSHAVVQSSRDAIEGGVNACQMLLAARQCWRTEDGVSGTLAATWSLRKCGEGRKHGLGSSRPTIDALRLAVGRILTGCFFAALSFLCWAMVPADAGVVVAGAFGLVRGLRFWISASGVSREMQGLVRKTAAK